MEKATNAMKTLLILRHAKSSWKDEQRSDHDRPLNKRGKRDAPRIGKLLRSEHLAPELIISSTARRARKTAAKVARQSGYEGVIELTGDLYLAAPQQYLEVLQNVPDHIDRVMVVGHNPGAEELLALLTGHVTHFSTAALAHVDLEIDSWHQLTRECRGQLAGFWRPSDLE